MVVLAPPTYVPLWVCFNFAHMHGLEFWESYYYQNDAKIYRMDLEAWYQSELPIYTILSTNVARHTSKTQNTLWDHIICLDTTCKHYSMLGFKTSFKFYILHANTTLSNIYLDHLPRTCNSVWTKDKLFHTSWNIRVILTMLNYTSWAYVLDSTLGLQAHKHVICYH